MWLEKLFGYNGLNPSFKKSLISGVVPSSLLDGEIAINQVDKKLFYKSGASILSKTLLAEGDIFSGTLSSVQTINGKLGIGGTPTGNFQVIQPTTRHRNRKQCSRWNNGNRSRYTVYKHF